MIQGIEKLTPQLQGLSFRNPGELEYRQIPVVGTRGQYRISSCIPVASRTQRESRA